MLASIIRFSVRNKLIIGLLTSAIVIWGVYAVSRLPIDAVPDITNNQVPVITLSPSLAAPEIERLVTFPVEQATSTIPGVIEMRSFSRFGLSLVTIVFDDKTDVYWARQQVSERLQQVRMQIPPGAGNPELAPVTTGLGEIFQYAVRAKKGYEGKYTALELRTIQDWIIRRQLLGTPGIADVSSFGGFLKQYEIAINTDKLRSLNISIDDVFNALSKNNQNTGGAYIERGPNVFFVRSEGLTKNKADLESIPVKYTAAGMPIFIRDLAVVQIGHATRFGAMCFNDQGEVAGAVVMMLKGENSSKVIKAVKEKIKQIEKSLPEGVMIEPFLDRTKMVNSAINTVEKNLLEGALIVVFILVIFLGNARAGFIVASVIPLSMLFAVIMMNLFGVSGNLMSLGALDFGLIVDGAVIIVEAVMHKLYAHTPGIEIKRIQQREMNTAVENAAGKMMGSAVFGQVIILVVYLPVLSLVGIEGKMFKPMAQTVSFALIGAFILSLTYVPMMTALLFSKKIKASDTWSDKVMRWMQKRYRPLLRNALHYPVAVVATALILFVASVLVLLQMGGEFMPKLEEGDFAVDTRVLTGGSLNTTIEATQKTSAVLLKHFPEVEKIVTKIGSGEIPTDPMPIEAADMMVILKDKKEWTSAKSFDELANKMGLALQQVPGVSTGFQFPVQMRFNELMTGARQDVVCKIFGEDLDTLAAYANHIAAIIPGIEGAKDVYVETVTGLPQIVIDYNRNALAMYRLDIETVNRSVRTAFAGESAGMVYENERRFDLVVRLEGSARRSINDIQNLLISSPTGVQVPLSQVASVQVKEGPNQIQRDDAKRRILVGFNVRGRDVESIVQELKEKVSARIHFPPGYYTTYGGQFENLIEAKKRLSLAVPVALALILVMLYFAFGSMKQGLLIFSAIPLSAIGGVFALWLRGMPFSISAGVGFIALFGVAVLNGIVLVAEFNRLKKDGIISLEEIVLQGTSIRLRPVLMTASVASLGFLPMALSYGAGAGVQRPLATVVIGGLITATLLTLFVLPVLYVWLNKGRAKKVPVTKLVAVVILLISTAKLQAQDILRASLEQMTKTALQNNLGLQSQGKQVDYWKKLQEAVAEPGKTLIGAEYGQINSFKQDSKFIISQSFNLPAVYRRQANVYAANEQSANLALRLQQRDIEKEIKLIFYEMIDLLERDSLLLELEKMYQQLSTVAAARLKAGETNILEATSSEAQWKQLTLQRAQIAFDLRIAQRKLQLLLGREEWLLPQYDTAVKLAEVAIDTTQVGKHPLLQWQQQQQRIASANTLLERNKLSPEFSLGYTNQSIAGWQSTDGVNQKYYGAGDRFNAFQLSVGIPIFTKATKTRIKASQVQENIAALHTQQALQKLKGEAMQWTEIYKKSKTTIEFYNNTGKKQADILSQNAQRNLEKGNMNYLEWTMLINQVVTIRLGWLEAVKEYNHALIQIEYLSAGDK